MNRPNKRKAGEILESKELTLNAVKILDNKKASNITALKVRELTIVSDYFIIASGTSSPHVKALADEVDEKLSALGVNPLRIEGYQEGNWVVVDYGELIIHIFDSKTREFYSLERLWADAEQLDLSDIIQ